MLGSVASKSSGRASSIQQRALLAAVVVVASSVGSASPSFWRCVPLRLAHWRPLRVVLALAGAVGDAAAQAAKRQRWRHPDDSLYDYTRAPLAREPFPRLISARLS